MPKRLLTLFAILTIALVMSVTPVLAQTQDDPIIVTDTYGNEVVITDASRIITLGGAVTETVFALGLGDRIVAVDTSSTFPQEATELPTVGYLRFLSAEPILSVEPTLIIATEDAGPPEVADQLEQSGVAYLTVPAEDTFEGAIEKIRAIAAGLDRVEAGEALVEELISSFEEAEELRQVVEEEPRVMFVMVRGAAVLIVAGEETGAEEMIELAGGVNAISGYEGYQPMTAEAVIAAEPDIILTTTLSVESIGGLEEFMQLPGVQFTPAGENGRIVYEGMEDLYLIGFTSRLGDAIIDLTYRLHEAIPRPITAVLRIEGFNLLLEAMELGNQDDLLRSEGPFTIFAPTDAAFAELEAIPDDPAVLAAILGGHLVEGRYAAEDIAALDGETLTTLAGSEISVALDGDTVTLNGSIPVVEADIETANGIIHVVESVILPD